MDVYEAWEFALGHTRIIRSRIMGLPTQKDIGVPYILLSPSQVDPRDTVVRQGEVAVTRPSLILPPNIPQLEGFDFQDEGSSFKEDAVVNFLLVRGVAMPSLKYDNKTQKMEIFEGPVEEAVKFHGNRLEREEETATGLLTGPNEVWPFSVLIFVCAQIARNTSTDIRRLLDEYRQRGQG